MRSQARTLILAGALVFSSAVTASAVSIEVAQESTAGAGDFDANILGSISSFDTAQTISQFYAYDNPQSESYNGNTNGGPTPVDGLSQVFFVNAADGLSLFLVHDSPGDGSGGSANTSWMIVGGAGSGIDLAVEDDPGDNPTIFDFGADRIISADFNWSPCCTDGLATTDLGTAFTIFGMFNESPSGIDAFAAIGGDLSQVALSLETNRAFRLRVIEEVEPPVNIPLPGSALLLLSGIAGLAGFRRRSA